MDLDDGYTRSSILMPQKRNPYALSIVRGASGVLIGRLTGFLAVAKSPSARSDNLIFAYGEVPRALDLSIRVTRLMSGVVRTLQRQRRSDGGGARRRLHPGHRPVRVHRPDLRDRLPQRLRRRGQDGPRGQPTRASRVEHHRRHARRRGPGGDRAVVGPDRRATSARCSTPRPSSPPGPGTGGAAPGAVRAMVEQCQQRTP